MVWIGSTKPAAGQETAIVAMQISPLDALFFVQGKSVGHGKNFCKAHVLHTKYLHVPVVGRGRSHSADLAKIATKTDHVRCVSSDNAD